jgi:hypothetical protein
MTYLTCTTCGLKIEGTVLRDLIPCLATVCCSCCGKQGLQSPECRMFLLETDRLLEGKGLTDNDVKGLLLERALSDALQSLKIPHSHNPFNITYPCYQNKGPDVTIQKLDMVIEAKNLSKKEVRSLSEEWIDINITKRPYLVKHRYKIVLFSFKPRQSLVQYLQKHGWRVYSLNEQILTSQQERKAVGKLRRRFHNWKKEYDQPSRPMSKNQKLLKLSEVQGIIPS